MAIGAAVLVGAGAATWACSVSLSGTAGAAGDDAGHVNADDASAELPADATSSTDGDVPPDATADVTDAPPPCVPFDAGVDGSLDLSSFLLRGNAAYNENADGKLTLTNSSNNERGGGWYPLPIPPLDGYDLSWTLRVGPGNTAGDGITFAVLQTPLLPVGAGDDGDGLGLRNVKGVDGGGDFPGYAVAVEMYKSGAGDPPTKLEIVTMPDFRVISAEDAGAALNDGNVYAVDVSWRRAGASGVLNATLHMPDGGTVSVQATDPKLGLTGSTFLGFTAATGGVTDSHNEIAGITVTNTCF